MGFFDRPPADPVDEGTKGTPPRRPCFLGGVVPLEVVLARSELAAVALISIVVFPVGFKLYTKTSRRVRELPFAEGQRAHASGNWRGSAGEEVPDWFLRFGVELPGGVRLSNLEPDLSVPRPPLGLSSSGGGGTALDQRQTWRVWPVPEEGLVSFVCEWPAYGIAESRCDVDASLIRDAALRSEPVWPEDAPVSWENW